MVIGPGQERHAGQKVDRRNACHAHQGGGETYRDLRVTERTDHELNQDGVKERTVGTLEGRSQLSQR